MVGTVTMTHTETFKQSSFSRRHSATSRIECVSGCQSGDLEMYLLSAQHRCVDLSARLFWFREGFFFRLNTLRQHSGGQSHKTSRNRVNLLGLPLLSQHTGKSLTP